MCNFPYKNYLYIYVYIYVYIYIYVYVFFHNYIVLHPYIYTYTHTHTQRHARLYYIPLYKNEELDLIFAYGVIKNKNKHINGMSIKEVIGMRLFVVYMGFIYLFIFKTYMCLKN